MSEPKLESPAKSVRKRLLSGASWQLGLTLSGRVFTFFLNILQGRYLGVVGYGQLSLIQTTLQFLSLFVGAAAGNTCTKYLSELRNTQPLRVRRILAFAIGNVTLGSMLGSVLFGFFAAPIATRILHQPEMEPLLRLSSFALMAVCVGGAWTGVLFGFHLFRIEAIARFIQTIVWFGACIALMRWAGVWGAVLAYDISLGLVMVMVAWIGIRALRKHNLQLDFRHALKERKVFGDYSLAVMFKTILIVGAQYTTYALLSRVPNGAVGAGRFFAAFQYRLVIQYLPMAIQLTAGPLISEMIGLGNYESAGRVYYKMLGAMMLGLTALAVCIVSFSPFLLGLFGKGFQGNPFLLASVMAYAVIVSGNNFGSMALQMHSKAWWAFRADAVAAIVTVGSALYLIPHFHDLGTALALQCGVVAQSLVYMLLTRGIGGEVRKAIGVIRYTVVVLLAPELCLLIAWKNVSTQTLAALGVRVVFVAMIAWCGWSWYRKLNQAENQIVL